MWEDLLNSIPINYDLIAADWSTEILQPTEPAQVGGVARIEDFSSNALDSFLSAQWSPDQFLNDWRNLPIEQGQQGGAVPTFTLISEIDKPIPQFKRHEKYLKFEIVNTQFQLFYEAEEACEGFFEEIFRTFIDPIEPLNYARICVQHPTFKEAINLPWMLRNQLTPSVVYKSFYDVCQSRKKDGKFREFIFGLIKNY